MAIFFRYRESHRRWESLRLALFGNRALESVSLVEPSGMKWGSASIGFAPGSQSEKEGEAREWGAEGSGEWGAEGERERVGAESFAVDGWRTLRRSKFSQTKKEANSFLERSYATVAVRNTSES